MPVGVTFLKSAVLDWMCGLKDPFTSVWGPRVCLLLFSPKSYCLPVLYKKNLTIKIYGTVILQVVLYGCETWSLTLRDEHRLRVSENRVLRIF
jgi:hypothetical protein